MKDLLYNSLLYFLIIIVGNSFSYMLHFREWNIFNKFNANTRCEERIIGV